MFEVAFAARDPTFLLFALTPGVDPIRDHPPYREMLSRSGIAVS